MEHTAHTMSLKDLLKEKRATIVKKWFEAVLETYPGNTSRFLKKTDAQFTNPVGYTLSEGIEGIYDAILQGMIPDRLSTFLDGMIRVRAVQDFTPSQAVTFIFSLKTILRKELGPEIKEQGRYEELLAFESAIDDLALYSFDLYMQCREKLSEIKVSEVKNNTFRLLQQAQRIIDEQGEKSDP